MESRLRLVESAADPDTVRILEQLLEDARDGKISGLAYIALQPKGGYSADIVGCIKAHPMLARGVCATLQDYVASLVRTR